MFINNLEKKISEMPEGSVIPTICSWSDLLAFSVPYVKSNWKPDREEYKNIAERLRSMQILCARNLDPHHENVIVSNDAVMRNLNFERIDHVDFISMWFRGVVFFHMAVNTWEKEHGYAGMRTVIAGGERLIHSFDDIRMEDYVFNYTKKDPDGLSSFPDEWRNRIVMYSPPAFQMNTAFSKSYILDDLGKEHGLQGANIYIDESVLDCLTLIAARFGVEQEQIVREKTETGVRFSIVNPENGWYHLGFELSEPFRVVSSPITTNVYKLLYFYPWDEDPSTFRIDPAEDQPSLTLPFKDNE